MATSKLDRSNELEAMREALLESAKWLQAPQSSDGEMARARSLERLKSFDLEAGVRRIKELLDGDPDVVLAVAATLWERVNNHRGALRWAMAQATFSAMPSNVGARQRRSAALEALEWARGRSDAVASSSSAVDRLEAELVKSASAVAKAVDALRKDGEIELRDGEPLALDEAFFAVLESTGPHGCKSAEAARARSVDRVAKAIAGVDEPRDLVRTWALDTEAKASAPRFLIALAKSLWVDVVRPALEAPSLESTGVRAGGDRHVLLDPTFGASSWAFGGPGIDASTVQVDGQRYVCADGSPARALLPRSAVLLPSASRPTQGALALDTGAEPLGVVVAQAAGASEVMSVVAAKTALLFLSHRSLFDTAAATARATLGDLARQLYPSAKRLQARELEAVSKALAELDALFLYFPDGTRARVFSLRLPSPTEAPREAMTIVLSLTPSFLEALSATREANRAYRAGFLYNLDGLLRLDNRNPRTMRLYVRAAADWNGAADFKAGPDYGRYDSDALRAMSLERMAARANTLPVATVDYIRDKRRAAGASKSSTVRAALSKALDAARADLEILHESGLVKVEKVGREDYKIAPPSAYLEAWEQQRRRGVRALGPVSE